VYFTYILKLIHPRGLTAVDVNQSGRRSGGLSKKKRVCIVFATVPEETQHSSSFFFCFSLSLFFLGFGEKSDENEAKTQIFAQNGGTAHSLRTEGCTAEISV